MLIASIKEINWLVFIQTKPLQKQEMQSIANEIGFSGSCFIDPMKKDDGSYDIRIFTPDVELPFAGHPVIGAAFVIRELFDGCHEDQIKMNLSVGQILVSYKSEMYIMHQNQPKFGPTLQKEKIVIS